MSEPGLGLRHGLDRRRRGDRRRGFRKGRDRRRFVRRHSTLRSLLLSALTLVSPPGGKRAGLRLVHSYTAAALGPVTVPIDNFTTLPPERAYDDLIGEAAQTHNVDPALIRSVMRAESGFDPLAVSRGGAMGLMQLMPGVAAELGVTDPFDPRQNIMAGSRLLGALLSRHRGNVALTLASYNAGPRAVARHGGRGPPFRETRAYVRRITRWLEQERSASD